MDGVISVWENFVDVVVNYLVMVVDIIILIFGGVRSEFGNFMFDVVIGVFDVGDVLMDMVIGFVKFMV